MSEAGSVGLIGLGVMGRNLALNMRDHGLAVEAWDPWPAARDWSVEGIAIHDDLSGFLAALPTPRTVLMLVKAGEPVEDLIGHLRPALTAGDALVDLGNSRFSDTERRAGMLASDRIDFGGVGVSGGAEGARHGPAMMAGCTPDVWRRLEPVLRPVAAQSEGTPCVAWFGSGGAGHFVKMVHNGIEYAVMQAIAEVCHALHFGGKLPHHQIHDLLAGAAQGYLVEITREILTTDDDDADGPLIDRIGDRAGQKGTGSWSIEAALDLGVAVPAIAEAVAARQFSSADRARTQLPRTSGFPVSAYGFAGPAIDAATAIALAQGILLAQAASVRQGWQIEPARMALAWRAGSILRMPILLPLSRDTADCEAGTIPLPLLDMIDAGLPALRAFTMAAQRARQPVAVLASCLAWADSLDVSVLPTRMVQAQRDRFGDHGFERTDRPGIHHGPWNRTGA